MIYVRLFHYGNIFTDVKQSVKHIVRIDNVIRMDILSYSLIVIGQDALEEHGTPSGRTISH